MTFRTELRECIVSNSWPAGPAGVTRISAPDYWIKKETEEA